VSGERGEGHSLAEWKLDLSILVDAGITVTNPPHARERANAAEHCPCKIE
jgi:hypothetical protein